MTKVLKKTWIQRGYRNQTKTTIVEGSRNIRILLDNGFQINKIGITVPEKWRSFEEIKDPALDVLQNPEKWPATQHILTSIDVTRTFMGSDSQPIPHELWAEVPTDQHRLENADTSNFQRVLIVDKVGNSEHLGEIIRAARGFAFDGGFLSRTGNADIYSPAVLRSSRLHSLFWPSELSNLDTALRIIKKWGFIPIFIRLLSDTAPLGDAQLGIPQYWRRDGVEVNVKELEGQKIALVVSGDSDLEVAPDNIVMSIPLAVSPHSNSKLLTSLAVAQATAIGMAEVARLMRDVSPKQTKGVEPSEPEVQKADGGGGIVSDT
jgi:tRNA G18 (ribose-2'-O)-methylase SpoU